MNKNFKGLWISSEVWEMVERGKISITEATILGMILGLENGEGCFASIEYFAGKMNLGSRRIQKLLKSLKDKNLIEQISINGKGTSKQRTSIQLLQKTKRTKVRLANKSSGRNERKFAPKRTKVRFLIIRNIIKIIEKIIALKILGCLLKMIPQKIQKMTLILNSPINF